MMKNAKKILKKLKKLQTFLKIADNKTLKNNPFYLEATQ